MSALRIFLIWPQWYNFFVLKYLKNTSGLGRFISKINKFISAMPWMSIHHGFLQSKLYIQLLAYLEKFPFSDYWITILEVPLKSLYNPYAACNSLRLRHLLETTHQKNRHWRIIQFPFLCWVYIKLYGWINGKFHMMNPYT